MRLGRAALVALVVWIPGAVLAQQASEPARGPTAAAGDEPIVGYRNAIDQAIAEHEAGNFSEARALFYRAHRIYPNARTLRGIGMVEFELKRYAESSAFLEQALQSPVRPLQGELRAQTEALLARASAFVARYELKLQPSPDRAHVTVDAVPVDLRHGQALVLTVGEHVIEVRAEGYRDEKRVLSVKGGEHEGLTIELRAVRAGPELATRALPAADDEGSLWSSPWLWTGVGALVAGGVIAVVLVASDGDEPGLEPGDVGGVVTTLRRAP